MTAMVAPQCDTVCSMCDTVCRVFSLPDSVLDIIAAADIVAGWDAADIVAASPVAFWPDASGNGFDLTQPIGAAQPTWGAATGPKGQPSVLFDGVDDFMSNAVLDRPAPGTEPTFVWGVLQQLSWTVDESFFSFGAPDGLIVFQNDVAPRIAQFNLNEVNDNTGLPIGSYGRMEAYFSNSTADYLKLRSTSVTGASAGNVNPGAGFILGDSGAFTAHFRVCELWIFRIRPTAFQLALLNALVLRRYGPGLT